MAKQRKNGVASEQNGDPRQNGQFFDPMSVTWAEKYDKQISRVWDKLPDSIAKLLATIAVFLLGVSINGEWISIWTHLSKQLSGNHNTSRHQSVTLESFRLNGLWDFWWRSMVMSYSMFYLIGGFIHWYYYVNRRHKPEEWKCQPKKWLSPELERNEIIWGTITLCITASMTATLSCFIYNGGYSTVYYKFDEYGWLWFFLQFPLIFMYQDYLTYWLHRFYHLPFPYKHFHKLHHRYKQPTAFSVTAIHPVEALHIQLTLATPLFLVPTHWLPFYTAAIYAYYHGIIDHSGVNFKSFWWQPWQPDAIFHDNHHQYFHVNFAFNISIWDKIHGTYRRKDRVYNEDTFYGTGKALEEASKEEIAQDLEERTLENPLAYRQDMPYKLSDKEVENLKQK